MKANVDELDTNLVLSPVASI